MNILYCGDGNIADGVLLSSLSLCRCCKEPLHIFILTAQVDHGSTRRERLSASFANSLEAHLKQYNPENSVVLKDITALFASRLPTANMANRFTPCCMLRLYADLVEGLPERILYLDNDVLCRQDPSDFYHQDLEHFSLAGSLDYYGSWFFRRRPLHRDYLNSGVLLLNMKRIRETELFEKCRKICAEEEMFMPDQSALNKLCADKRICHRRYNEQRCLQGDTVFQHFTTGFRFFPWFHTVSVKPWNIEGMHKILGLYEYDPLLEDYLVIKKEIEQVEQAN